MKNTNERLGRRADAESVRSALEETDAEYAILGFEAQRWNNDYATKQWETEFTVPVDDLLEPSDGIQSGVSSHYVADAFQFHENAPSSVRAHCRDADSPDGEDEQQEYPFEIWVEGVDERGD